MLDSLFFKDKEWLHWSDYVNSKTSRICSAEQPHTQHENCLHSSEFGVWYAAYRKGILDNCSLKTQLLLKIIQLFDPFHYLAGRGQTGLLFLANFHTANTTTDVLQNVFVNRIIGHGFCPPRSPGLTSRDFFLWGFLKVRVYNDNTRSLEDFKHNIEATIFAIDQ